MIHRLLPIVGIATRSIAVPGRQDAVRGVFSTYVDCIRKSGGEAVLIPPGVVEALSRLDALLLVGGEDLSTEAWWAAGVPGSPVDPERDAAEALLVDRAYALGMPVLGICRGAQMVNCVLGGSVASLDPAGVAQHSSPNQEESAKHLVLVAPNTRLASAMGINKEFLVVSRHQTRIAGLGVGLQASAWAEDGTIEAVEASNWPFIGIQWHSEWSTEGVESDLRLFLWLINEGSQRIRP
jgi:putative glutamine amidotransferase